MKINKNIKWLLLVALAPLFAACSWEDLPAYEDANIEGVAFYYRFKSPTDKDPITGEPIVKNVQLSTSSVDINSDEGTVSLVVRASKNSFPTEIYDAMDATQLVGTVTLSTAARIAPADNHKALGLPDDWTEPHRFVVTAANGDKKNWTITVTEFRK